VPSPTVRRRIFLVGCGRSGTTLLQSLLASHPEITSFPESHFFPHLHPGHKWARRLGLVSPRAPARFDAFVAAVGWPRRVRPRLPFARGYARAFVRLLDAIALEDGKANWVEKTPHHLRYIEEIESHVPDAVFIHIIRSGADVVASFYAASHDPSFKGFGRPMSLDECIERWTTDVEITRRELAKPNHYLVRYETLVSDPSLTLRRACAFLGLTFDERMLHHQEAAQRVILSWEHWKAGALEPIRNANGKKLHDSLRPDERRYVVERTSRVEIPSEKCS